MLSQCYSASLVHTMLPGCFKKQLYFDDDHATLQAITLTIAPCALLMDNVT